MITKIETLTDYHLARREWWLLLEMNPKDYYTPQEEARLQFLDKIMDEYAIHHVEEIWPSK